MIWQIYPHLEEVNVCLATSSTTCSGEVVCSAAPALPAFQLAAKDIFKKPE